ncbi:hypothetical protein V5O48_002182 [Marasmius crinis-equi]|uniref:SLC26A/SulP transporter domain-containing protein n=1 Tax=Marasmius crinis-equi TaxID=585013 RepID=A0ABR3FWV9_9AGAR
MSNDSGDVDATPPTPPHYGATGQPAPPPRRQRRRSTIRRRVKYYVPSVDWVPNYSFSMLAGDLLAGVTVASMLIPQSVSYATSLAKLTPTAGLFSASIPPIVYALLGSSRQLNVAPEAALSLLLGQAVEVPLEFADELNSFILREGRYRNLETEVAAEERRAFKDDRDFNPINVLKQFQRIGSRGLNSLKKKFDFAATARSKAQDSQAHQEHPSPTPLPPTDPASETTTETRINNSLTRWIAVQLPILEDDDNDNDAVRPEDHENYFPMALEDLFDFDTKFWQDRWEKNVRGNLEEEMMVFEWLNLDAEGDDEEGVDDPDGEQELD